MPGRAPRSRGVRAACLLALAILAGPAGAGAGRPVAVGADVSGDESRARLTIALSESVPVAAFLLEGPDRAVLDLPEVNFQIPAAAARKKAGLVAGFRSGLHGPGRSRIVVDLSGPATLRRLEVVDGAVEGVKLLVAEFGRTDRASFRRAVAVAAGADGPGRTGSLPAPARPPAVPAKPLVAIDAGHGGTDSGAISVAGVPEKDVVLAFAETLRDRLVAAAAVRVLMTRDGDVFVPLDERVRRARAAGAALFVSIHADSISSRTVRGATVYTGAERATDAESAGLAERENAADARGGHRAAPEAAEVRDILQELTARETRGFSHRFAGQLLGDLASRIRWSVQPHREAGFRVLRAHDMPSVLVELGYLSNHEDTDLLLSDGWRRRTGEAMAQAVERFFAARPVAGAAISP